MNNDIAKLLNPYFDGIETADKTMHKIASLPANNRILLKTIVFDWIEMKITADRAIAKIREAYNL